jgi:transcriptional antiterminator NusG
MRGWLTRMCGLSAKTPKRGAEQAAANPIPVPVRRAGAMRWYIVHAYSNHEKEVGAAIHEQAQSRGLGHLLDDVMVPIERVVEIRRGRRVHAERRFFPGYVLVRCELTDELERLLRAIPKVTGFLEADSRPMPITDAEAERILKSCAGGQPAGLARGAVA